MIKKKVADFSKYLYPVDFLMLSSAHVSQTLLMLLCQGYVILLVQSCHAETYLSQSCQCRESVPRLSTAQSAHTSQMSWTLILLAKLQMHCKHKLRKSH